MEQGLYLMAVGMGTVFAFLTLMVMVMNVAAKLFEHFGTEPEAAAPQAATPAAVGDDERDIAVVLAAVEAWRRRNASGGQ